MSTQVQRNLDHIVIFGAGWKPALSDKQVLELVDMKLWLWFQAVVCAFY
jgi:hypothetical protein